MAIYCQQVVGTAWVSSRYCIEGVAETPMWWSRDIGPENTYVPYMFEVGDGAPRFQVRGSEVWPARENDVAIMLETPLRLSSQAIKLSARPGVVSLFITFT